jgi:membrane protein required for colicin V production
MRFSFFRDHWQRWQWTKSFVGKRTNGAAARVRLIPRAVANRMIGLCRESTGIGRTNLEWVVNALVAVIALAGAFRGMRRGLIREGLAIAGVAVGVWLAGRWHEPLEQALEQLVGGGTLAETLAYLLVVLAAVVLATLLTVALDRFRRIPLLGGVDRGGGALLGAAQGAVLAALILVLMLRYPVFGLDAAVGEAALPRLVVQPLPQLLSHLPPELAGVRAFFVEPLSRVDGVD